MSKEIRQKLYEEFIQPFENQKKRHGAKQLEHHNQLLWDKCGLSSATLSRAFGKNKEETPEKTCKTVYDFLIKHWKVGEDGWFYRITSSNPMVTLAIIPHPRFPKDRIMEEMRRCNNDVRAIDTAASFTLSHTEDWNERNILSWVKENNKKLKLLFLDPSGKTIDLRMRTNLFGPSTIFRNDVIESLRDLLDFSLENPNNLEIHLMDELPAIHGIILSDCIFWGLHYFHKPSQNASFFELQGRQNHIYIDFDQHFEKIWRERSRKLDRSLFEELERKVQQMNYFWPPLAGNWEIYFHDLWENQPRTTTSPLGHISRGILEIEEHQKDKSVKARLHFPDALKNEVRVFESEVQFETLGNSEFVHLFFSDNQSLSLKLIIHCEMRRDRPVFGYWMLLNNQDLNTSPLLLKKIPQDEEPAKAQYDVDFNSITSTDILRNLAFIKDASFSIDQFRNNYDGNNTGKNLKNLKGVYKMYSFGRHEGRKGIQMNIIEITEFGYVRYQSAKFEAHGTASIKEDNLHIILTHDSFANRTGYFILHIGKEREKIEKDSIFAGVFLGISLIDKLPVSRLIIIAPCEESYADQSPKFYSVNTPDFETLSEAIRKALISRATNLIGFLQNGRNIFTLSRLMEERYQFLFNYEDYFYEAALTHALQNDKETALILLARAVEHGFYDLSIFESAIKETDVYLKIIEDKAYQKLKRTLYGDNFDPN